MKNLKEGFMHYREMANTAYEDGEFEEYSMFSPKIYRMFLYYNCFVNPLS